MFRAACAMLEMTRDVLPLLLACCYETATANALLASCKAWHAMRSDARAVGTYIMRCARPLPLSTPADYRRIIRRCCGACVGGLGAVISQMLTIQDAPALLLLLWVSMMAGCVHGLGAVTTALQAMPDDSFLTQGPMLFMDALLGGGSPDHIRCMVGARSGRLAVSGWWR